MKLVVNELRLPPYAGAEELKRAVAVKLGIGISDLLNIRIIKEAEQEENPT